MVVFELPVGGDARSGIASVACALSITAGQWHTLHALKSGTIDIGDEEWDL